MSITSLCVYCGASTGHNPAYADAARLFGRLLAERGIRLVYGGGNIGLMGILADAALAAGGTVIGVIPQDLAEKEVAHRGLSELITVDNMHERKLRMANLADAFVALPGGIGTLEELFEVYTWQQLGFHAKPIGLLDVAGYYRPLLAFLDQMVGNGFLRPEHRQLLRLSADPEQLLATLASYAPAVSDQWYDHRQLT
jgi:hypothetical protein